MLRGRRRPGGSARAVLALCLASGVALAPPASASPTDPADPGAAQATGPSAAWTEGADSPASDSNDRPLTGEDLQGQVAQADRLAANLVKNNRDIARAVADLKAYSSKANGLLQKKATARDDYESATKEAADAQRGLDRYRSRLASGRKDLRDWAFDTYTEAGGYSDAITMLGTLTHSSESGGNSAGDLTYLTDERIRTVDLVREDTLTQAALTRQKARSKKKAASAKRQADKAKQAADKVLRERRTSLATLRAKHAGELKKAGPVVNALIGVPDGSAQGASQRLTKALTDVGQDVSEFEGSRPCSTNTKVYPNGQIPPSGLCPLLGAPGESLRPGAAAAFNSMSKAYQRDTGHVLCVTDSYRSYAEQVVTKGKMGRWAATPGRSEHGLGQALDLCGGINSFGHPAHLWMQQNAPLHGWFHPSWAESGGSLPEPWHWEYAG